MTADSPLRPPPSPDRSRARWLSRLSWGGVGVGVLLFFHWARPVAPLLESAEVIEAPPLSARSLGGPRVDLAALRGKVVVVNFWATWCGPCREEIPELTAFARAHRDVPLLGVAVSSGSAEQVRAEAKRLGIDYDVLLAPEEVRRAWKVSSIPVTYVVDAAGKIVEGFRGPVDQDVLLLAVERAGS